MEKGEKKFLIGFCLVGLIGLWASINLGLYTSTFQREGESIMEEQTATRHREAGRENLARLHERYSQEAVESAENYRRAYNIIRLGCFSRLDKLE